VTTTARSNSFERSYDLPERVLPRQVLAVPTPSEAEAQRVLMRIAATALGVATAKDLRDYFRMSPGDGQRAIESLVESGDLLRSPSPAGAIRPISMRGRGFRGASRQRRCSCRSIP